MSRLLIISRQAPYGSSAAREALELALAGALFDQQVSLLLLDDAVFQLVAGQNPAAIQQKNHGAMLQSLPMYDVENLYASERSLNERGLEPSDLILPVKSLSTAEIQKLISEQDKVFHV